MPRRDPSAPRSPRSTVSRAEQQVSPIDLVDPTVAARPAQPDGGRIRARRRQHALQGERGRCRPRRPLLDGAPARGLLGAHPRLGDAVLRPDDPVVDRERSLHGPRHPASRRSRARAVVLDVEPGSAVVRPPEGALDDAAVTALAALGATTILGDADTVERPPQPNEFAPPPTATLAVGGQTVDLVLPDAGHPGVARATGVPRGRGRAAQAIDRRARDHLAGTAGAVATARDQRVVAGGAPGAVLGCVPRTAGLRAVPPAGRRADLVAEVPPPAAPSVIVGSRDRTLLPHLRRRHQARAARPAGVPIDARGADAAARPARSSTSSTPSPASTSATRPRGRRGSIT